MRNNIEKFALNGYDDKPEKNMYSHIHDALQYLMLGAGEGRQLISGQKPLSSFIARRDFNVFDKKPSVRKKSSIWANL